MNSMQLLELFLLLLFPGYIMSHGIVLEPGINCTDVKYWVPIPGKEIIGGTKTIIRDVDLDECKRQCNIAGKSCQTFDRLVNGDTCELHSSKDGDPGTIITAAPGKIHYYETDLCDKMDTESEGGTTMGHPTDEETTEDKSAPGTADQSKQGHDDDDDDKNQFMRWVEDSPEYVVLVGMSIFVLLLLCVIIGMIIAFTQKKEKWEIMSSKV